MHLFLAIVFLSTLTAVTSHPIVCPKSDSVFPCSCKNVAYGLRVICADINSFSLLQTAFSSFRGYVIDNLLLHSLNFSAPENLFDGMQVNVLRIEESKLTFTGPAFHGLESSLTQLNVVKCSIKGSTDSFSLSNLNKLRELDVERNKIETVENIWLRDTVPNLRLLALDHNEIVTIGNTAFANLLQLQQLSLSDNEISVVTRSMFPDPANELQRLDLSHNVLQSLPEDMFQDMPSLSIVVLSRNELRTLPERTWSTVWSQLEIVLLYANSIVCDGRISWIKDLSKPAMLEGTCAAPEAMMGKSLRDAFEDEDEELLQI